MRTAKHKKPGTRFRGNREKSFWAKVDKTETCWNWEGALHEYGYGNFGVNRGDGKWRTVRAHRWAWEKLRGPITPGMQLDHICHNRRCVNPGHLRETTNKQNHENYARAPKSSTTGYRGVYYSRTEKRYRVQVTHNGKRYFGGSFTTAEPANKAAIELRNKLHTHNDLDRKQSQSKAA